MKFLSVILILSSLSLSSQKLRVVYQSQAEIQEGDSFVIRNAYQNHLDYDNGIQKYYPIQELKDKKVDPSELKYTSNAHVLDQFNSSKNTVIRQASFRIIYKDHKKKKKVIRIHKRGKDFLMEEAIAEPLDWKITDKTKKIDKYSCKLAEAGYKGRIVRAWFTEEIPVSIGPDTYFGLPGLILEYKYARKHVFVKSIDFKPDFKTIEPPTVGEKMTREEFKQYRYKQ